MVALALRGAELPERYVSSAFSESDFGAVHEHDYILRWALGALTVLGHLVPKVYWERPIRIEQVNRRKVRLVETCRPIPDTHQVHSPGSIVAMSA